MTAEVEYITVRVAVTPAVLAPVLLAEADQRDGTDPSGDPTSDVIRATAAQLGRDGLREALESYVHSAVDNWLENQADYYSGYTQGLAATVVAGLFEVQASCVVCGEPVEFVGPDKADQFHRAEYWSHVDVVGGTVEHEARPA